MQQQLYEFSKCNTSYIDAVSNRINELGQYYDDQSKNSPKLNQKYKKSFSMMNGDNMNDSLEKKENKELEIKINRLEDVYQNLSKRIERVVNHELKKSLFNNLTRIDSKIDKLDGKVNRLAKCNTANLKVKLDAINVKKNSCLSKWDKFEVDLGVENYQKTTFVIHQKKRKRQ